MPPSAPNYGVGTWPTIAARLSGARCRTRHAAIAARFIGNKTNALVIAKIYGPDTAAWIGKPIEICHDPNVMLGRDRVGGIRVRIPTGPPPTPSVSTAKGATPKAAPAPSPSAPPPTLEQRHAQLLAGFDGALTEENLTAWGRWGKQFSFTETQQGEAEDRFHDAMGRIARAHSPTRRAAHASA